MSEFELSSPEASPIRRLPAARTSSIPPVPPPSDFLPPLPDRSGDSQPTPLRPSSTTLGVRRRDDSSSESSSASEREDHTKLVDTLVKRKHLGAELQLELGRYARLGSAQQRIMTHAAVLELKQSFEAQTSVAIWTPSSELQTSIKKYSIAYVLSADCSAYKKGAPDVVLKAMQAAKVSLPAKTDVGRVKTIIKAIGDELIKQRASFKGALQAGVNDKTDLASLAAALVSGHGLKVTLEIYHRLAWLRDSGSKIGWRKTTQFWDQMDKRLSKARDKYQGDKYEAYFASYYRKDVDRHKLATDVSVSPVSEVTGVQKMVDKVARESAATIGQAKAVPRRKKRRVDSTVELESTSIEPVPNASTSASS